MELVFPIKGDIKLSPSELTNVDSYEESGYYLVNDGIANLLASVDKEGNYVYTTMLPYEVMKLNNKELVSPTQKLEDSLEKFDELLSAMEEVLDRPIQPHEVVGEVTDKVPQKFVLELINAIKKGK